MGRMQYSDVRLTRSGITIATDVNTGAIESVTLLNKRAGEYLAGEITDMHGWGLLRIMGGEVVIREMHQLLEAIVNGLDGGYDENVIDSGRQQHSPQS